jgi:hypothetical protein
MAYSLRSLSTVLVSCLYLEAKDIQFILTSTVLIVFRSYLGANCPEKGCRAALGVIDSGQPCLGHIYQVNK